MAKQIGNTLGQYQILDEVGRGGMAVVYRGYQPSLQRYVAIKVLPPQLAVDSAFVQRFLQEARSAARLEHPNIVAIHDVGEVDGTYFIVMQMLAGEPLNRLIQREGRLPAERVARIASQIAAALDYAYSQGFVHRDVKPANIIVGPGDHATLTDFGVAKALQGGHLTQTGAAIGTPEYMSPEQAKGEPVGPASDIYALGLVVYEMLTGEVPFTANSTPAILYKQVHERPAPVRSKVPGVPASVDKALARALAKVPAERYRTAGEFAAALMASVPTIPVGPMPSGSPKGTPSLARKSVNAAAASSGSGLPKWALPVVGIAIVIVLAAIMLPSITGDKEPAAPGSAAAGTTLASPTALAVATFEMPAVTELPSAKPTSVPSKTPIGRQVSANPAVRPQVAPRQDINVYGGPAKQFGKVGQVEAGKAYEIVGRNDDNSWWLICCVGGEPVWIDASLVTASGEPTLLPVVTVAVWPTDTPSPTATTLPQPTPTRQSAPPPTPTPQTAIVKPTSPPPPPSDCRRANTLPPVTLIAPAVDKTCNGPVRFTWQWSDQLRSGEVFELHLWPNEKMNRGRVAQSTGTSLVTDISKVPWILWERPSHWWEVIVVCKADGRWISQEPGPRLIYFDGRIPVDPNNPDANCR